MNNISTHRTGEVTCALIPSSLASPCLLGGNAYGYFAGLHKEGCCFAETTLLEEDSNASGGLQLVHLLRSVQILL